MHACYSFGMRRCYLLSRLIHLCSCADTQKRLQARITKASAKTTITIPDPANPLEAVVQSFTDPSKEYRTDLHEKTCECGVPDKESGPCSHLIHHAHSVGMPISDLLDEKDSVEGWQKQYPADLEFKIPSESKVLNTFRLLINQNVHLPLVARRKAGRPATKRKKGCLETARKKPQCRNCFQAGHNKRTCPFMPMARDAM